MPRLFAPRCCRGAAAGTGKYWGGGAGTCPGEGPQPAAWLVKIPWIIKTGSWQNLNTALSNSGKGAAGIKLPQTTTGMSQTADRAQGQAQSCTRTARLPPRPAGPGSGPDLIKSSENNGSRAAALSWPCSPSPCHALKRAYSAFRARTRCRARQHSRKDST